MVPINFQVMPIGKLLSIGISDSIASTIMMKQPKNGILTGWRNIPKDYNFQTRQYLAYWNKSITNKVQNIQINLNNKANIFYNSKRLKKISWN